MPYKSSKETNPCTLTSFTTFKGKKKEMRFTLVSVLNFILNTSSIKFEYFVNYIEGDWFLWIKGFTQKF
jgi:hypothetical protein